MLYVDAVSVEPDNKDVESLGLLDDLHGKARQERAELVTWLLDRGFDADQIRGAFIPMLLPANRAIGDDGTSVSAREISQASGVSLELLQRLHRAAGLVRVYDPDSPLRSRADAEAVLNAARLIDLGLDPARVVLVVRLLVEGLTGPAVAMRRAALQASLRPGATELDLAKAFEHLAQQAAPLLGPMVHDLLRLALRHSFETEAISVAERAAGALPGAREVAVAFADLVGFTHLGEKLPPEELGLIAGRLSDLAHDVVMSPVQFVKTIGDAVMLVCAEPLQLLTTVLNLVEAAVLENVPRLRAGFAFGRAISRSGDWYGNPVNLANRVTHAAPSGAVWVTESAREVIGDAAGIEWSGVGARHLRGVHGEVRLYAVQRTG
ncbi:pH-sensitive adenylate cyclase [Mycobacterium attenuatum]|uniref:pH-sensitive adenylate cyclase n=1 Tax=Mycobacterium attenuatum TaxID=2341086 RepID=A0A498PX85_9MYCO|nr:pH-sensitive adenylate cyclase [Mycobacterium attenuatum]VBA49290.1 pH-sensitive adenylate cyclase [Mycobacterium attenuatum]VBA54904.1 pH-sensitive adenylate cyclase [Mycobacterium attenuatum]